MISFPNIKSYQYYVSFAELNTGIVLNADGNYYFNGDKNVFHIFDNYDTAKKFVSKMIGERPDWEGYIYNFNKKIVYKLDKFKENENKNELKR
jgi:hypothetical protein